MKRRWLVLGVLLAVLSVGLWATAQEEDEASFWDKFKTMFVDWDDDNYEDTSSGKTEVVGLRGVNIEQALANGYDWQGVRMVENYEVGSKEVKNFLEQGHLGPYQ